MLNYGFTRLALCKPTATPGDMNSNCNSILSYLKQASAEKADIFLTPRLSLTTASLGDLFCDRAVLHKAEENLKHLLEENTANEDMLCFIGLPVKDGIRIYDATAAIQGKTILSLIVHAPQYTQFSPFDEDYGQITLCGQDVLIASDISFIYDSDSALNIRLCAGSDLFALAEACHTEASIVLNPRADNEDMRSYKRFLNASKCISALQHTVLASVGSGYGEAAMEGLYSGSAFIAENGDVPAQNERYALEGTLTVYDVDYQAAAFKKSKARTYAADKGIQLPFHLPVKQREPIRHFDPLPFLCETEDEAYELEEAFNIQINAVSQRLTRAYAQKIVLGVSGGLDSTLALLVAANVMKKLAHPASDVVAVTMPGFGTTDRTYQNALILMQSLGCQIREIPIRDAVTLHFKDIGHDIEEKNVVYENAQARERTQILMDIANGCSGIVLGTGDLSEAALGWSTFNGDHMAMYGANSTIPKTLIRRMVTYIATYKSDDKTKETLFDILDTPVSPELLPPDKSGKIAQKTEESIGAYELHDFFLYHMILFGHTPEKLLYTAKYAFRESYDEAYIQKYLNLFYRRFMSQQFKRATMPESPKVTEISLSARSAFELPSELSASDWMIEE